MPLIASYGSESSAGSVAFQKDSPQIVDIATTVKSVTGTQKAFLIVGALLVVIAPLTTLWLIPAGLTVGWASSLDY